MHLTDFAWIVLFLPLLSAAVITLWTQRDARFSAQLSIGAVAVSFFFSLALLIALGGSQQRMNERSAAGARFRRD